MLISRRSLIASGLASALPAGLSYGAERPIRIGVLNDPGGPFADIGGVGSVVAARLAVEDIGGTVAGRAIEVLQGDHQNKPDVASAVARKWIDQDGVDIILDGASSACGLAIQHVCREKNKFFIAAGSGTSDLTNKFCAPYGMQFSFDTFAQARSLGTALTKAGGSTWFFITADYAFGHALERDTTRFVKEAGGKVLGSVRHPLGTMDFSSVILQAQTSGAQVIGLANAAVDTQNTIKQANEFGLIQQGLTLAALIMMDVDIGSIGLPLAQNLKIASPFYWDRTDATRAWTERFMKTKSKPPTMLHAGVYSAALHYLKGVKAAGTTDTAAVNGWMRSHPVVDMNNDSSPIRSDGRLMCPMYIYQAKKPSESRGPFDLLQQTTVIDAQNSFRPAGESECTLLRS